MSHKLTYYEKISLKNKSPEEAERIKKLFNDNIRLADKAAKKYYSTPYWDFDESIQMARMSLWKACLIWDPSKYRLSTLAYNIINRDFMDYDREQKRQPDILFNMEDNCVTDDLNLNDIIVDKKGFVDENIVQDESVKEISEDMQYIMEDISDELNIPKSIVKAVCLAHICSNSGDNISMRDITFIKKTQIRLIIDEFQKRLMDILYGV